jgi:hypothetical protein
VLAASEPDEGRAPVSRVGARSSVEVRRKDECTSIRWLSISVVERREVSHAVASARDGLADGDRHERPGFARGDVAARGLEPGAIGVAVWSCSRAAPARTSLTSKTGQRSPRPAPRWLPQPIVRHSLLLTVDIIGGWSGSADLALTAGQRCYGPWADHSRSNETRL